MTRPWDAAEQIDPPPITATGWLLVAIRGPLLFAALFSCFLLMLLIRIVERPLFGLNRPWTPYITRIVCRLAFVILGIGYKVRGRMMRQRGAVVANHASWLDILALNARKRVYFVSKSEVAVWPFIGRLARVTGTVFIRRDPKEARAHNHLFEQRLKIGHRLLFFPEGTSTDGLRVLPFKSTLFAAFFAPELRDILAIQPVTLNYRAPPGADPRYYGWWGDMGFGSHLLRVLATARQGSVELVYHSPVRVADCADRKALARRCEEAVRAGLPDCAGSGPA